jgi:signal peptidase II
VDFLNVGIGGLRTGIFNLADVAILAGIGLVVWLRSRDARSEDGACPRA